MNTLNEDEIFRIAREVKEPTVREAYLRQACGDDDDMLQRLQAILEAGESESFLEGLPFDVDTDVVTLRQDLGCVPGETIGPYRIREKIGEGGMGIVYVAEQTEPVQRRVALKVIKPGMDTREVIARFEAERQALAFMEHPNIARVLDAGATESGRSYFVMELVRGIPITDFCDQSKATTSERLELFKAVCDAVQHAHQKGIIHRDIKPSNVLVTQVGAKPVVKVIDFGLAKATSGQKLTDKTVYTGFMKLMGTPVYMSPEQAGLSSHDIDTRSDVYSLGVLLYELLTGTTPLDKTEIGNQAYEELCRQIREVEAPKPSARISTLKNAERSTIAQQRQVEPARLRQLLNGDLDRVVLKALQKDREHRYESPKDLAADVDRFLEDKPVLAVPPSLGYLAKKYFRRHKVAILTGTAIALSLLLATIFSTRQAIVATKATKSLGVEKRKAEAARVVAEKSEKSAIAARDRANRATQDAVDAKKAAETSEALAVEAQKDAVQSAQQANIERDKAERISQEQRLLLSVANIAAAASLWDSPNGDLRKIEELISAGMPTSDSQHDIRDFAWRYQWTLLHKNAAVTKLRTTGATLSPDGNLLTADEKGLHEWDDLATNSTMIWSGDASNVLFSSDRRWAAITTTGTTKLIELSVDGKALSVGRTKLDFPHNLCSFSPGGEYLTAWSSGSKTAKVWNLSGETPIQIENLVMTGDAETPTDATKLQLSEDGKSFLLRGYPIYPCVTVFLPDEDPVTWWHRNFASSCVWSPNGKIMASGSHTGMLHLRLRDDPLKKLVISTHGKNLDRLRFSPDGTRLAVGGSDGTFDLWDTSALLRLSDTDPSLATQDNGEETSATSEELLAMARPTLIGTTKAHLSGGIKSLTFSADGSRLATFAKGDSKLWDLYQTRGRYEVADLGEDLFNGRLGFEVENSKNGVRVSRIFSRHHDVVSGEIHVDDIIVGAGERQGELTDITTREDLFSFYKGPVGSIARFVVEGKGNERREVALRRKTKSDPRPIRVCFAPEEGNIVAIAGQRTGTTSINLATGQTRRYPQAGSKHRCHLSE